MDGKPVVGAINIEGTSVRFAGRKTNPNNGEDNYLGIRRA